jgi:hypothetical protein
VSAALKAAQDAAGNGEIVLYLEGAFSAFYDGTSALSSPTASSRGVTDAARCTGRPGTSCSLAGTLSTTETLRNGKVVGAAARVTHRTVRIGSGRVVLAAGTRGILRVGLAAGARKLVHRFHRLKATLLVTQRGSAGVSRTVKRAVVTLR